MECWECNDNTGEKLEVEYTDGKTATVQLCDRCREDFTEGDFVRGVRSVGTG